MGNKANRKNNPVPKGQPKQERTPQAQPLGESQQQEVPTANVGNPEPVRNFRDVGASKRKYLAPNLPTPNRHGEVMHPTSMPRDADKPDPPTIV